MTVIHEKLGNNKRVSSEGITPIIIMQVIKLKDTVLTSALKGAPIQAKELATRKPIEKWCHPATANEAYPVKRIIQSVGDHCQIELTAAINGEAVWWIYKPHWNLSALESMISLPNQVSLNVPYLSQLDNENNPTGSCNVTSVAMCLGFYGHPLKNGNGVQLEDELYEYCENTGLSRHNPHDLVKLFYVKGCADKFSDRADWKDVKAHLSKGKPVIVHGWFTHFGHIIVIKGYNSAGWLVNDPYGEWFGDGYNTNVSGEGLIYSYSMMSRLCSDDGQLWIHYTSKC